MEKRFIVINYPINKDDCKNIVYDVANRLLSFVFQNSDPIYKFNIYTGIGPRGDKGIWLEFEPSEKMTTTVPKI